MYQPHPSLKLTELFRASPYQGAPPEDAEFVFVGLDANYEALIESTPAFERVLEYHDDGVAFWRRHKVHHPFLLPDYTGDGRLYHRNFAKIGFEPEDAHRVSFVELLHLPSVGGSQLIASDLEQMHLDALNALMIRGAKRNVFLSDRVVRVMRASGRFRWLRRPVSNQVLPVLHEVGQTTIYQHLHFSNYGALQGRMRLEALAIGKLRVRI